MKNVGLALIFALGLIGGVALQHTTPVYEQVSSRVAPSPTP